MSKLFSGRYALVLAAAIVFVYCSVQKILDAAVIATILTAVFKDYFNRPDRPNGNGNAH